MRVACDVVFLLSNLHGQKRLNWVRLCWNERNVCVQKGEILWFSGRNPWRDGFCGLTKVWADFKKNKSF